MEQDRKTVFISYSWEDIEHQNWVLKLAGDLQSSYGIKIIIDKTSIHPGSDLPYFMESSIDKADKVLVILTPEYKKKAESRSKGVGYETTMLSQELFESPITKIKIIPILRKGNKETSSPKFLSSKAYHSMIEDSDYEYQILELAKAIYEQPLVELPPLGPVIDFSLKEIDPFIAKANSVTNQEELNREINQLLFSEKGKFLADDEIRNIEERVKAKKTLYEANTDLHFTFETNHRDQFIIQCYGFSVIVNFENISSNVVHNLKMRLRYFKGYIKITNNFYFPGEEPKEIKKEEYIFDLNTKKEIVWKNKTQLFNSEQITKSIFGFIIDKIQEVKGKKNRD